MLKVVILHLILWVALARPDQISKVKYKAFSNVSRVYHSFNLLNDEGGTKVKFVPHHFIPGRVSKFASGEQPPAVLGYTGPLNGHCLDMTIETCRGCSLGECSVLCNAQLSNCAGFIFKTDTLECFVKGIMCQNRITGPFYINFWAYYKGGMQTTQKPITIQPPGPLPAGYSDNTGSEFILMFAENGASRPSGQQLEIYATNRNPHSVVVSVTTPKWNNPYQDLSKTVEGNDGGVVFDLSRNIMMTGTGTSTKGIYVRSSGNVSLFGMNKDTFSADGFLVLPTNLLGKEYYTACYTPASGGCVIGLVGAHDNTQLAIELPKNPGLEVVFNGNRYGPGDMLTARVNRFDTIQLKSTRGDLTGTHIISTKPLAVFSGNPRTSILNSVTEDFMIEQMLPVKSWSKEFLLTSNPASSGSSVYRFVASEDNTQVTIAGVGTFTLPKAGNFIERVLSNSLTTRVQSNKPVMAVQFTPGMANGVGDGTMVLVPSIDQMNNRYTFTTMGRGSTSNSTFRNYVRVVVPNDKRSEFYIIDNTRGQTIPLRPADGQTWSILPTTSNGVTYATTVVELPRGVYGISHQTGTVPFSAMVYGAGNKEGYGFLAGQRVYTARPDRSYSTTRAPITIATTTTTPRPVCVPTVQRFQGDRIDNDCDGRIDEEPCDGRDNDNDGRIDEDCYPTYQTTTTKPPCYPSIQRYQGDRIDNDCDGQTDEEPCDGRDNDGDGRIDEDCYPTYQTPSTKPPCIPSVQRYQGDRIDNDCDGQVDEEPCDGRDNDMDGRIDEDCYPTFPRSTPSTTVEPKNDQCIRYDQLKAEGKEFILMFMKNLPDQPKNLPLELYVTTTSSLPTTVKVSSPKFPNDDYKTEQTVVIYPNDVKQMNVSRLLKMESGSRIANKGLLITADQNIVVYGINKETYSNDGFLALPTIVLGNEYYAVCWWPPTHFCEIGIAGTRDGTYIDIQLPPSTQDPKAVAQVSYNNRVYKNGQSFRIQLDRLNTFQLQSKGDLSGTRITSNAPISVFSGNVRTSINGTSRDHLVEQLVPTNVWGRQFITTPTPKRTVGDIYKIVGFRANTQIDIRGIGRRVIYRPGDVIQVIIPSGSYSYITSDQPIMVTKFVFSQTKDTSPEVADPSMILIPPIEQYDHRYGFSTTEYAGLTNMQYTTYVTIVIKSRETNGLLLDGRALTLPVGKTWVQVPGTDYVAAHFPVSRGAHILHHYKNANQNTLDDVPFAAFIYGAGDRESYGFPAGMRFSRINQVCVECPMRPGDGIDNDCDQRADEEDCNGLDDDGDGRIDEDCREDLTKDDKTANAVASNVQCAVTCFGRRLDLQCPVGQTLKIISAHFGRMSFVGESRCNTPNPINPNSIAADCGFADISASIRPRCDSKQMCSTNIDSVTLGQCTDSGACQLCSTYAYTCYDCVAQQMQSCYILSSSSISLDQYSSSSARGSAFFTGSSKCSQDASTNTGTCARSKPLWNENLCAAYHARLGASNQHAWCPEECDKIRSFVQIDMGAPFTVSGILMQGRRKYEHWVTRFGLQYSNDGKTWSTLTDANGAMKEFQGNVDARTLRKILFQPKFNARYIRVVVLGYNGYPAMHVDVIRCNTVTPTIKTIDACAPVRCKLYCPKGFQKDSAGCDICACAGW